MDLATVIDTRCISFDVPLATKEEVFTYLIEQLNAIGVLTSTKDFLSAVHYRESLSETGIGNGIAIPHGKAECVTKASVAFVRLAKPIAWPSLDDQPVQLVFLLAIPKSQQNDTHIRILSELARSLIRDEVVAKVHQVKTAADFMAALA